MVKTHNMRGSPYFKAFEGTYGFIDEHAILWFYLWFKSNQWIITYFKVEVCDWETQLARIQNILETWMFVQEQWLCFEPILSTADIASKMETEGRLFKVKYKNSTKTFRINALFGRLLHNKGINCIRYAIKSSDGNTTH